MKDDVTSWNVVKAIVAILVAFYLLVWVMEYGIPWVYEEIREYLPLWG